MRSLALALTFASANLLAGLGGDDTWYKGSGGSAPASVQGKCVNCEDDGGGSGDWTAVQVCSCGGGSRPNGTFTDRYPTESACKSALAKSGPCDYACCSCRCEKGSGGGVSGGGGPKADTEGIKAGVNQAKQAVNAVIFQPRDDGADLLAAEDREQRSARYGVGRVELGAQGLGDGPMESLLLKLQAWCQRRFPQTPKEADRKKAAADLIELGKLQKAAQERFESADMSFNQRQRARLRLECAESVAAQLQELAKAPTPVPQAKAGPSDKLLAYAAKQGLSAKELQRLREGIDKFTFEQGDGTLQDVQAAWEAIQARQGQELSQLQAAAQSAPGPDIFKAGAGEQGRHNDCALWALANASGTPYGVVTARAGEMFDQADWRDGERLASAVGPGKGKGLRLDEVMLLTESLGQMQTVDRKAFDARLAQGQPIMASVSPPGAKSWDDGHQVVLTKSFKHAGKHWYEMMDSNDGPLIRRYVSADELKTLNLNQGVIYLPEGKRKAALLR